MSISLGFYWRKLFFFAGFAVVAYALVSNLSYFKADTAPSFTRTSQTIYNLKVEVLQNGRIKVDDKYIKERVDIKSDFEEVRLPLIDNPGAYIEKAKITLILPKDVSSRTEKEILGIHGVGQTKSTVESANRISYEAQKISPYGVVSIVAKMPKGTVSLSFSEKILSKVVLLNGYWLYIGMALPFLVFLLMLIITSVRFSRQKVTNPTDEKDVPPMMLPPAVVGVLYRQKLTAKELSATLIDLAIRDNIFIIYRERSFGFGKNKLGQLLPFEKILLSKIFKHNLFSDREEIERRINNHLYSQKISLVSAGVYEIATRLGYFRNNLTNYHKKLKFALIIFSVIFVMAFFATLLFMENAENLVFLWLGCLASTIIVYLLANKVPIRTDAGRGALVEWLKFRNFLSNPSNLEFSNDNYQTFEKYLPYAMALDCEVAWVKRFSGQNFMLPDWFITDKSLVLEDFCLALFPIISYVGQSFAAIREPGFD